MVPEPLTLEMNRAFWASNSDYQSRLLTVSFTIHHKPSGFCSSVVGTIDSNDVTSVSAFPIILGDLGLSGSHQAMIKYHVPLGVSYFSTTVYARSQNACGEYPYPGPFPG